ncbi:MAG: hypothetical protein JKY53_15025 [Flavobacteriales bacterium]|nr:hypothetical protein [Flavobacteriales bacterium]
MNFNSVVSDPNNTIVNWEADILQDGYVGSITDVKGGPDPIRHILPSFDNVFEPICSSKAEVTLMVESLDFFVEFQTADVYEYYIDIKRDGATYFKGVLIAETYTEQFQSAPYTIKIIFNDGLAELQFERFDNSGVLRTGFTSLMDILTKCFSFLPFLRKTRELINIFEDTLADGDTRGLLEQIEIYEGAFWERDKSDDVIKGENCLEVIRGIMSSLKCRIIVSQDMWYIIRIGEMFDASIKFVQYDTAGAVESNSTISLAQTISKTGTHPTLLRHLAGGTNNISREYQEVEFDYTSKNDNTIDNNTIINWDFSGGFDLENGSPVPKLWKRSAAVNTVLATTPTALRIISVPSIGFTAHWLRMEEALLTNTGISSNPQAGGDNIIPIDATRESFSLTPEDPSDSSVSKKDLLHNTADHLEIRIKGWVDYTRNVTLNSARGFLFFRFKVQLGSDLYNTSNQVWNTTSTNRVWTRVWTYPWNEPDSAPSTKRRHFDERIVLANFPSTGVSDLTVTWFIPENGRPTSGNGVTQLLDKYEITVESVKIQYVSNNSTEFATNKVLGETGSTTLRTNRFKASVKHSDGPSDFSIMSFRRPTTNLATTLWSTRGGAEALPGYKILVIDPIFENMGKLRQVFNGPMYGFLELHNTISGIDSKVMALKGFDFSLKSSTIKVKPHEVAAFSPVITYFPQFDLSGFTNPDDSTDFNITATEDFINNTANLIQGLQVSSTNITIAATQPITGNNDDKGTAKDYPI